MEREFVDVAGVHPSAEEVRRTCGDDFNPFAGAHHARFIDASVPLHIISRVFQGRHLLRPCAELNSIIIGVIGRSRQLFPDVRLYAAAFMSNHVHLMLQGPAHQVPAFIGFIKREISRRWGGDANVKWPGTMWHGYITTALPTEESQVRCLKYILSQGVKEGLVARPQDWPGVHAAKSLMYGHALKGRWLNATAYARANDIERRKRKPMRVDKSAYYLDYEVRFDPIPTWQHLDPSTRQAEVVAMVTEIEAEGRATRQGGLGASWIRRVPLTRRTELPPQPWFENRRRMICWANPHAPATQDYIDRYWSFQRAFRLASDRLRAGELAVEFPTWSFRPGMNETPLAWRVAGP